MLGRCDRMGRASPWLPAPRTFPRRERTERARAPFSFPDTLKEYRQEGEGFHIPLGLRLLLNTPTQAPSQAWVTQLLPHTPLPTAFGDDVTAQGGLYHQCHEQLAGGTSPLSQLKPAPRVSCSEVSQQLVFWPRGLRHLPALLPWQHFRVVFLGAATGMGSPRLWLLPQPVLWLKAPLTSCLSLPAPEKAPRNTQKCLLKLSPGLGQLARPWKCMRCLVSIPVLRVFTAAATG